MKKVIFLTFALLMCFPLFAESWVDANGTTFYYTLDWDSHTIQITNCNPGAESYGMAYVGGIKPTGDLVIPQRIQGFTVTSIGNGAYYGCNGLTSVTLPATIESIGESAFMGCFNLRQINFPEGLTYIGANAFANNYGLIAINFPYSLNTIESSAFSGCRRLTSVTFPENIEKIGNYAFNDCVNLRSINFNAHACVYPRMGEAHIFANCSNLHRVTFGSEVTIVPKSFLYDVPTLDSILSYAIAVPTAYTNSFPEDLSRIYVQVPCQSVYNYENHNIWGRAVITGAYAFSCEFLSSDISMGTVNVISAPSCGNDQAVVEAIPLDGYHFSHWSDGDTTSIRVLGVAGNIRLIAYFAADIRMFNITVLSADPAKGTTIGSGTYKLGDEVIISALPFAGKKFVQWNDGNTNAIRTIIVNGENTFIAAFGDLVDITSAENESIHFYASNGGILVENPNCQNVRIFDITGKMLVNDRPSQTKTYTTPYAGVFMVQIGDLKAAPVLVTK